MSCVNVLELLASLVTGVFVEYVEYRFPGNIKNIDNNGVIEVDIVPQVEPEISGRLGVLLTILTIFREVFQYFFIDIVICPF